MHRTRESEGASSPLLSPLNFNPFKSQLNPDETVSPELSSDFVYSERADSCGAERYPVEEDETRRTCEVKEGRLCDVEYKDGIRETVSSSTFLLPRSKNLPLYIAGLYRGVSTCVSFDQQK